MPCRGGSASTVKPAISGPRTVARLVHIGSKTNALAWKLETPTLGATKYRVQQRELRIASKVQGENLPLLWYHFGNQRPYNSRVTIGEALSCMNNESLFEAGNETK